MREAILKVPGGKMLRVFVDVNNGVISSIMITGDFFLHPEDVLPMIEEALVGKMVELDALTRYIDDILTERHARFIGASARDVAQAIVNASSAS